MVQSLTILAAPVNAVGHTNSCAGALTGLLSRRHRIIFLLEESFRGKLAPLGYEEYIYTLPRGSDAEEKPGEKLAKSMVAHQLVGPESAIVKLENWRRLLGSAEYQAGIVALNSGLKRAVAELNPDCIYYDGNWMAPEIAASGKPWIKNISVAPIFYEFEDGVPPGGSGLPTAGDQSNWPAINSLRQGLVRSRSFNDLVESLGYPRYPDDQKAPPQQILTVYAYPEELNYEQIRAKGWFNLEVFNKPNIEEGALPLAKLVPEEFLADNLEGKFSGKLIYVSMGSMGSVNLQLMKHLVDVLGRTAHKYIFSKGPRHQEYSLPRNMFGDRYLPQTSLLPHVDLVITHGGNNTVTETFAQGKPMIVLPLFVDQFDNAQRLTETGFGSRIDPFAFTERQMNEAIDRLLYSKELKINLKQAATRIASQSKHTELAIKIEELLNKQK